MNEYKHAPACPQCDRLFKPLGLDLFEDFELWLLALKKPPIFKKKK